MNNKTININYKFTPAGTIAPETINKNEIWVDVGNRASPQVMDHHGGDVHTWSAAQLVVEKHKDYILDVIDKDDDITIVLHNSPDLDAICSVWLVEKLLIENINIEADQNISEIVNIVSANDQGIILEDDLQINWIVIVKILLNKEYKDLNDEQKLKKGKIIFDKTYSMLKKGFILQKIAKSLSSPYVRIILSTEKRDYIEDLSKAITFQMKLPVEHLEKKLKNIEKKPFNAPDTFKKRWSLADCIFITKPSSLLFKEFARNDTINSVSGMGFSFICVAYNNEINDNSKKKLININPKRYIISTDPLSGLHLKGLGTRLEQREQKNEDASDLSMLPGRERVPCKDGRFGFNVISPWYDGRGHNFTIIDSPLIKLNSEERDNKNGKDYFFSQLTTEEILETIWNYGDPAKFIRIKNYEYSIILNAETNAGWEREWQESVHSSDIVLNSSKKKNISEGFLTVYSPLIKKSITIGDYDVVDQKLFKYFNDSKLLVIKLKTSRKISTLKDFLEENAQFESEKTITYLKNNVYFSKLENPFFSIRVQTYPEDISFSRFSDSTRQMIYQFINKKNNSFFERATEDELENISEIVSSCEQYLISVSKIGSIMLTKKQDSIAMDSNIYSLDQINFILMISLITDYSLKKLSEEFIKHRLYKNPIKAGKFILSDREKLFLFEQNMDLSLIFNDHFLQKTHELITDNIKIIERFKEEKSKIDALAEFVIESRANLNQRIAFFVTTILAPMAITVGFFSGTHMQKEFAKIHYTFLPSHWQPAGWIQFGIVFLSLSIIVGSIWVILSKIFRKKNFLNFFKKRKK